MNSAKQYHSTKNIYNLEYEEILVNLISWSHDFFIQFKGTVMQII